MDDLERLRGRSITELDDATALDHIGLLIDVSQDAGFLRGAERALYLLDEFAKRDLNAVHSVLLEYFRANAWSAKSEASGELSTYAWEGDAREQQILALSRAAIHPGFVKLDLIRRCQILTNRANQLQAVGRIIDAIEGWDEALGIIPEFAIAQANRAHALKKYGALLDEDRERALFLLGSHDGWVATTAPDAVYDAIYPNAMKQQFVAEAQRCAAAGDLDRIRALLQDGAWPSLGRSKGERSYRRWCLEQRLFLNPLNDLGTHTSGAFDTLLLPAITESVNDRPNGAAPPPVIGFFNQMKQEYASARFMLYEGIVDTKVHFADRGVLMLNTLDYPEYSLATERVRIAYRLAYSLLDKVAFLINHYWKLGKIVDRISFKSVWMVEGKSRLQDCFKGYLNWPLQGLFWLSKELFDDQLRHTTGPDARELHAIRNALEHKYLQVHASWAHSCVSITPSCEGLGVAIESEHLKAKALRVLKMARSALIQLSLAISVEERERRRPKGFVFPFHLSEFEDRRKTNSYG